jgi:hypothetical protein
MFGRPDGGVPEIAHQVDKLGLIARRIVGRLYLSTRKTAVKAILADQKAPPARTYRRCPRGKTLVREELEGAKARFGKRQPLGGSPAGRSILVSPKPADQQAESWSWLTSESSNTASVRVSWPKAGALSSYTIPAFRHQSLDYRPRA